jgi:hypothetical protein
MIIDCIIRKKIEPKYGSPHERKIQKVLSLQSIDKPKTEPLKFEKVVFNYFFENKETLGISKLYQLESSSTDGLLELVSGQTVLLEIKYALNWSKSCQARIQFLRFLTEELHKKFCVNKPENGLIIFHHFSGDFVKRGWDYFYEEENVLNKNIIKTDIAQLTDGCLIPYPVVTDW